MPRGPRIDLPGLLQHVIVRGIERRAIFLDDADRERFCGRLASLLEATGTQCLAWALLPNHGHLLLRPLHTTLSSFMRRLLTGYAVTFNLRHQRSGHLFQNRYKSIVCEEEEYLLELVRYIHLNPLRARLVPGMAELDRFRWGGHAVLMGHRELRGQEIDEVLRRFATRVREARRRYRAFVKAGIAAGRREELVGGGLRRSVASLGAGKKHESYDERVLGSGAFVERLRQEEGGRLRVTPAISLEEMIERAARLYGLEAERVLRRSTLPPVVRARSLVSFLAVEELGYNGTDVGRVLGISRSGTSKAVARGRALVASDPTLRDQMLRKGQREKGN